MNKGIQRVISLLVTSRLADEDLLVAVLRIFAAQVGIFLFSCRIPFFGFLEFHQETPVLQAQILLVGLHLMK